VLATTAELRDPEGVVVEGRRVVAANALVGYAGSVVLTALRFATKLVLIRSLAPADFGRVVTTQNLQGLAMTLAGLAVGDAVLRFVGVHAADGTGRAKGVVYQALRFLAVSGIGSTVLLIVLAGSLSDALGLGEDGFWGVSIAALAIAPLLLGDAAGSAFQGLNRTWVKVTLLDVPRVLLTFGGYILLATIGWATYTGALAVQLGAAMISAGLIAVALWRAPELRFASESIPLRSLLSFSLPVFGGLIIGGTLVAHAIPLALATEHDAEAVALYAVALTVAPLLQLPAIALENAALPVWAGSLGVQSKDQQASLFAEVTRWGLLLALIAYVPFAAAPQEFLALLFGNPYAGPTAVVQLALAAAFFPIAVGPTEGFLMARAATGPIVVARTVSGLIALAAAWPLVATWGVMGAVAAWATSNVISNGVSAFYVAKLYGIHPIDARYVRLVIAGATGLLVSLLVAGSGLIGMSKVVAVIAANLLVLAVAGQMLGVWHPAELKSLVRQSREQR
jgi:O-antigen/teichoic acid export membrane protein